MSLKIVFTIISTAIGLIAFFPYLKDIFSLKTKPHIYTWLIWGITQGTAVVGIWSGGGGWGNLNLITGTVLVIVVFLFSFKYGTKNITKGDTIILVAALLAVLVWWQLHQLLLATFMVSVVDLIGYIPSFRKSYKEPWSETLISWVAFVVSDVFALLALDHYNLLTTTYLTAIIIANTTLFFFCLLRRLYVSKPSNF
jgi:hypothetical protein